MVGVEQWAEIRRMHRVERLSIRDISRRTGLHRKTVRRALSPYRVLFLNDWKLRAAGRKAIAE